MEKTNTGTNRSQFCRICGRKLLYDSIFCDGCGTKVIIEYHEKNNISDTAVTFTQPSNDAVIESVVAPGTPDKLQTSEPERGAPIDEKPKRKKQKIIIPILLVAMLVCTAILIISKRNSVSINKQDINVIDGCPEFYNVQFGMTAERASSMVEIEHKAITGYKNPLRSADSMIYLEDGAEYELYGIPARDVYCGFDVLKLDSVLIIFSKEDALLSDVIELYTKIYGEPTERNTLYATWSGKMTTIDIYDTQLMDTDDNEIVVRYRMSPNRQYKVLTFDGPEYDPCNFLETQVFTKEPKYYTNGLVPGEDYDIEKNDYFTKYTLYPMFEFMGIEEGMTAISFDVDAYETEIGVYSYLFLLEKEDASDHIKYIKDVLEKEYGTYSSCTYTSMKYDELGIMDLTYSELLSKVNSSTQGIYNIQWDNGARKITLNLTIDPISTYYSGSVSTSG